MENQEKQFNKAQETFSKRSISDSQKQVMLSSIYSKTQTNTQSIVSPLSSYFMFFRQKAFVAVAVVVLLVSGTSYASAHSLPGDLLYPVKTKVIEPIVLSLKFSEESKNEYKVKLLEKRLEELEKLESEGKLNTETKQESSEVTDKNVKDVENSAVFDVEGKNEDVSAKVKSYNNITDKDLKIESEIIIESEEDVKIDLEDELDVDVEINLETEEDVKDDIEDLTKGVENKGEIEQNIDSKIDL